MKRVLVISPHPDDEAIGCGGTLRKHVVEGDLVDVVFLTSGEKGGHGLSQQETAERREQEARVAATILGLNNVEFYREPDGSISATPAVAQRLSTKVDGWVPSIIYLPHDQEMHADHRTTVEIVREALAKSASCPDVLMFEVWTPLQRLDVIIDISAYVETKREAIRAYRSQCAVMDFEQAILGLNRYRGEMHSWPGGDYAEVFSRLALASDSR